MQYLPKNPEEYAVVEKFSHLNGAAAPFTGDPRSVEKLFEGFSEVERDLFEQMWSEKRYIMTEVILPL